jgi:uncharacterized protein (DUF849 family)
MTARKVWVEAALNGPWGQLRQPLIPSTVEDIVADGIACARAGAAIIHVHAYDERGAAQTFDWQVYARIIGGIRAKVDVPVYPSIPSASLAPGGAETSPVARFAHTEELARRGLLELAVVDPGSVNFASFADIPAGLPGHVYLNPEADIRHGLALAARHGFHPGYAIYEPGFTRLGAALWRATPGCPRPLYRFMFSDGFAWGFPPQPFGLEAHARHLEHEAPGSPWMAAGLDVDILSLIPEVVRQGGHIRVGLEDAPFGTTMGNVLWVEEAVALIRSHGAEPATAADVRAGLRA